MNLATTTLRLAWIPVSFGVLSSAVSAIAGLDAAAVQSWPMFFPGLVRTVRQSRQKGKPRADAD